MDDETAPDADEVTGTDRDAESARFLDELIARGEAAELDAGGNLPDGATHELVIDEHGRRRAVRRRYFGLDS